MSFEKSGGFGKTPCVKAKIITKTNRKTSKIPPIAIAAPTAGKVDPGIDVFVR